MSFNYEPICYGKIKTGIGEKVSDCQKKLLDLAVKGDESLKDINIRQYGKTSCFTDKIVWENDILQTITAGGKIFRGEDKTKISHQDIINACTFPQDYNFLNLPPRYVCGMSVPPIMIFRVVTRLIEGGIFDVAK
jgi:DNA (cytosine-5)-methyltransferase 1